MDRINATSKILQLMHAELDISLVERVQELIATASPEDVARQAGGCLAGRTSDFARALLRLEEQGFSYTNVLETDYPALLREVREAPAVIYWEGALRPAEVGVSIVGSRSASGAALNAAYQLAGELARHDIPVISGLAAGIDGAAHAGALDGGGRTVAVMGTPIDKTYPKFHQPLRERIVSNGGMVMTQFEIGSPTGRRNFPMRNAVMSGYGVATIVMAAQEKSGTRHQVQAAVKHGRKVIFTGTVANTVSWAHKLVQSGKATSVPSLEEAVEAVKAAMLYRHDAMSLF